MALLTEKQIEIITLIALNQSTSKDLYDELCEWNEKQATQQFEPDWEKTSSNATKVYLDAVWFNSEMKEIDRTTICGWDRPTPHPHAALIMKYAEVATTRPDPWVEFEIKNTKNEWIKCIYPFCFYITNEYRYIGDEK